MNITFDKIYCGELNVIFGWLPDSYNEAPRFVDNIQKENFNTLISELKQSKKILFITWQSKKHNIKYMLSYIQNTYEINLNGLIGFKGNSYNNVHDKYIKQLCPNNWVRTYRLKNKIISYDGYKITEYTVDKMYNH